MLRKKLMIANALVLAGLLWAPPYSSAEPQSFSATANNMHSSNPQPAPAVISPPAITPSSQPPIPLTYKNFTDPMQGAFSLMVPDNWKVNGGMVQPSTLDVRPDVQVGSPDGEIVVFMGDSKLPPFAMPAPILLRSGHQVGSTYSPGAGVQMVIEPYQTAQNFLAQYGPSRLSRTCTNITTDNIQNQPALAAKTSTIYSQQPVPGVRSEFTMADGHFHCVKLGAPHVAYIILGVQGAFGSGPGTWLVPHLWGYISTPERESAAAHVLGLLMTTFKLNPQWVAKTNQNNASAIQITEQTNQAMIQNVMAACQRQNEATTRFINTEKKANTMVMGAFERQQAASTHIANEWSNTILGIHTVENPSTGERRTVDNGYNYYWQDRSGNIVGTSSGCAPGPQYTQMNILRGQ